MQTQNSNIQIRQELVNSIVHGFGIILVVSIPILIAFAIKSDNTSGIIGAAIYGFFFYNFYFFYTLPRNSACSGKRTLEILDHISIYFLIGYLHSVLLMYMPGITLLSVLWGLTALGIIYKIFFYRKMEDFSTIIYIEWV
jgi:hemolysin III